MSVNNYDYNYNMNMYTLETLPKTPENTTRAERSALATFDDDSFKAKDRFMRFSELITHLQSLQREHGDLPVFINSEDTGFIVGFNAVACERRVVPGRGRPFSELDGLETVSLEIRTNYSYTA